MPNVPQKTSCIPTMASGQVVNGTYKVLELSTSVKCSVIRLASFKGSFVDGCADNYVRTIHGNGLPEAFVCVSVLAYT